MSQAVAVDIAVDIPSLIRRYQLPPEHYYPSYLRHPNQPFSSPSSVSSSCSSPLSPPLSPLSSSSSSVSSFDQECDANDTVNESSGAISVDGEVDTRIDIIQHQQLQQQPIIVVVEKKQALDPSCMSVCVCASAPPLSDDDIEHENSHNQQQPQTQQQQQQKEEVCVCVICYETFEQPDQLIRGQNYSMEELEEIEGKQKITDFCQTCKYNVHHKCIDEYRLSKITDIIRSGYQRGRIQSPNIAGIFGMKCLMCAKEVEKIHISSDGDISVVKTQAGASEQNRRQQQQQHQIEEVMQNRIQEAMQNRMQRRVRRRQRVEFCRKKLCSICIMFLVTILLLVFIFRVI
jgi:hypothetical protein